MGLTFVSEIKQVLGGSNDKIINTLVLDLIKNSYNKDNLAFSRVIFQALKDLIKFNDENIYFNPRTKTESHKIENMLKQLFEKYCKHLEDKFQESPIYQYFLNDMNDDYRENNDTKRIVIDFIAGMTDDFFNNQYKELFVPKSYGYSLRPSTTRKTV